MLDLRPTEVDRLVRHVLAAWGRAEAVVYGSVGADESVRIVGAAAVDARSVAAEIAELAPRLTPAGAAAAHSGGTATAGALRPI